MSVINQMLKDLEQRNTEAPAHNAPQVTLQAKSSNTKNIIVTVIIVMLFNVAGFFVWSLYSENQSLKSSIVQPSGELQSSIPNGQLKVNVESVNHNPEGSNAKVNIPESNNLAANQVVEKKLAPVVDDSAKKIANQVSVQTKVSQTIVPVTQHNITEGKSADDAPIKVSSERVNTEVGTQVVTLVEPIQKAPIDELIVKTEQSNSQTSPAPKITISRKQLTADELAQQKMSKAEKAIDINDLVKAEQLFEDTLLIQPEHKEARKQLAALWYGRQSYQSAINLLAQGITLAPQYAEFRLMQAKLYLAQGNNEQAYQTLVSLPSEQNSEYQLTLANSAQQLGKFSEAVTAYQVLVNLQPKNSRWWLGLAVAFDSNSQFIKAKPAYQSALSNGGLSQSSVEFIRQRLTELGE